VKLEVAERIVLSTALDPWLSLRALSAYSGLSIRTLRAHIAHPLGPLPFYRLKAKILVRRSEFDSWMQQHRQVGVAGVDQVVDAMIGPGRVRR